VSFSFAIGARSFRGESLVNCSEVFILLRKL